ncbi:MAG: penicillin-binding protein 1A [Marinagarivorans sp.]|nr:penicillin-binding protein 1A [Marinagarivorans sp.]
MLKSLFSFIFWLALTVVGGIFLGLAGMYLYLSPSLPSVETLRDVKLQTPLRVYSADNKLIGEFGEQRRSPIRYKDIPKTYIDALLAAEDEGFYSHNGVSIKGLMRALSQLLITGERRSGGSTITMQVTRHFFLDKKKHFKRKFNEILLAMRIENELSKADILELYVNVIFLGNRAYGIQAAAHVYYGKPIDQLSTAQLATIAALPKAPSTVNPIANPERAKDRRDWILGRMTELKSITLDELKSATAEPITAELHQFSLDFEAPYVAELARQEALELLGPKAYTEGYSVYTSINTHLQEQAQKSVMLGLNQYDLRHGYRGPEAHNEASSAEKQLEALRQRPSQRNTVIAFITNISDSSLNVLLLNNETKKLEWPKISRGLRFYVSENQTVAPPTTASEAFKVGDIIRLAPNGDEWTLTQIPEAQSSLVSIDAFTGQILALIGGYDFHQSSFNRAVQAQRLPGSNFKPFLYAAALENGFTPATLVNDAPIVFNDDQLEGAWRPENSSGDFYGPMRLRKALYLSRNLVSIRILKTLGIKNALKNIDRFGVNPEALPHNLSLALGTHAVTPLSIAQGYTVFANGGYKIKPYLLDYITNPSNEIIYQTEKSIVCSSPLCTQNSPLDFKGDAFSLSEETQALTKAKPTSVIAPRVMSEDIAFLMDSMLKDVVRKGTAVKAKQIKRSDLAGKTGTTNGPVDAWFSGYAGGIVTTTWVGFDDNRSLGRNEYGGSAALPIWINYMEEALTNKPELIFPQPVNIVSVRINPETGERARINDQDAIFEFFRTKDAPQDADGNTPNVHQDAVDYHEELF